MSIIKGTIKSCLILGEYDQGDICHIEYDELYNLQAKAKKLEEGFDELIKHVEKDAFSEHINGHKVVYSESLIESIRIIKAGKQVWEMTPRLK